MKWVQLLAYYKKGLGNIEFPICRVVKQLIPSKNLRTFRPSCHFRDQQFSYNLLAILLLYIPAYLEQQ